MGRHVGVRAHPRGGRRNQVIMPAHRSASWRSTRLFMRGTVAERPTGQATREKLHKVSRIGRFSSRRVERNIITDAQNSEAMVVRVISIDFRLSPAVRRLARSFSRLTGVPLARLLEHDRHGAEEFS